MAARFGSAGSQGGEGAQHPLQPVAKSPAGDAGADLEVLPHRHVGEDVGELRHHVQPEPGDGVGPQTDQVVLLCPGSSRKMTSPPRGRHQPIDRLQQGRFAAAVGSDHGDDGPVGTSIETPCSTFSSP